MVFQVDDLYLELDNSQRDSRQLAGEAHKLRGHHDALSDQVEGLKRENKALSDQVGDYGCLTRSGRVAAALIYLDMVLNN